MSRCLKGFFCAFMLIHFFNACTNQKKQHKTPLEYDLNKPAKFKMSSSLLEISGISFYKGNKDTIYCIQDEDGKVFRLAWGAKKPTATKFGKKGDYEDIAVIKNKVVVLKSDGTLYTFAKEDVDNNEAVTVEEWKGLLPAGEYEGLYGDDATGKLYVLCKKCVGDAGANKVSGYIFDLKDSIRSAPGFTINVAEIEPFSRKVRSGFRPSALAKNHITGEWFILSGAGKLLVITDANWKVKDAYPLNGNTFYQAEGIAFDAAGNLFISNEGDDLSDGNILQFVRRSR